VTVSQNYKTIGRKQVAKPKSRGYKPGFMSSVKFASADFKQRWLIQEILVADQPAVIGGAPKSLKTGLAIDMAISLGTGTPFLGKFAVPCGVPVAFISGESGAATIQNAARRISAARDVTLDDCEIFWSFRLPRLGSARDISALVAEIRKHKIKVVFIDPLYLCLSLGGGPVASSNLYDVGPRLLKACRRILRAGATPILIHHSRKESKSQSGPQKMDLQDLSFAGIAEFARQWILLARLQPFDPAHGKHQLSMNVGGSAGHSGLWQVNVTEGQLKKDFTGRKWKVSVNAMNSDEDDATSATKMSRAK
jgi:replicative DNA helicase